MMKKVFLFLLIFISLSFSPIKGFACSCLLQMTPPSIKTEEEKQIFREKIIREEFENADVVFSGEVLEINLKETSKTKVSEYFEIKLKVQQNWKGSEQREIKILTPDNCFRYRVKVGESYLIYAGKSKTDNFLWTSICAGNLPLEQSADKLKVIQKIEKKKEKD